MTGSLKQDASACANESPNAYDDDSCASERYSFSSESRACSVVEGASPSENSDEKLNIAVKETRAVFSQRIVVFGVLFIAAIVVSTVVYVVTSKSERDSFKRQFQGNAAKVATSFNQILEQKLTAIGSVSNAYTAFVHSHDNVEFPFVTMPDFSEQIAQALRLSGAIAIYFIPLVTDGKRAEWEAYTANNSWWLKEGTEYQESLGLAYDQQEIDFVSPTILGADFQTMDPGPGPYWPTWQMSPITPYSFSNANLAAKGSSFAQALSGFSDKGQIVISPMEVAEAGWFDNVTASAYTRFYSYFLSFKSGGPTRYEGDPISNGFYPVFDSFNASNRAVVGSISFVINWAPYFKDILPPSTAGVYVVLQNPCQR
jgi:hypothetical protein